MSQDVVARGMAVRAVNRIIPPLSKRPRKLLRPLTLAEWTSTPGSGNTITSAADTANGAYAGGELISMALTSGNATNQNQIECASVRPFPQLGSGIAYYVTGEFSVPTNTFLVLTVQDGSNTNLLYAQLGLSNNQITLKGPNSPTGDLTVSPTNWDMTKKSRFSAVINPSSSGGGTIDCYLHYTSTSTTTEAQYYLGRISYTSSVIPTKVRVKNGAASGATTGTATVARVRAYETFGVMVGCSIEAGYVGWCPDPDIGISFAANSYNEGRNPADLMSMELFGDVGSILNHARGGFLIEDMASGYDNWVTPANPALVVIGSPTNSIVGAAANYTEGSQAQADYITSVKATYLTMLQKAVAQTGKGMTLCMECAPRSDTAVTATTGGVAGFRAKALDFNTYIRGQAASLGAATGRVFSVFEDPNSAGHLLSAYDAGDNVHLSWRAQKLMAVQAHIGLLRGN